MPRVRKGVARHRKHKRLLKAAKGYYGANVRRYRLALQQTFRAGVYATRDRRRRKREFRRLWITRIAAACRQRRIRYSQFVYGLGEARVALNRKMLSEIAIADPPAFDAVVELAMAPPAAKPQPEERPEERPEEQPEEQKPKEPVKKVAKKAVKKVTKKTAKKTAKAAKPAGGAKKAPKAKKAAKAKKADS